MYKVAEFTVQLDVIRNLSLSYSITHDVLMYVLRLAMINNQPHTLDITFQQLGGPILWLGRQQGASYRSG